MITGKQKQQLIQILEKSFKNTFELGGGKEYRFFHGIQVATFAEKIAQKENLKVDFDTLFIAALFHDIGKIKAVDKTGMIDYQSKANKHHEEISSRKLQSVIGHIVKDKKLITKSAQIILETKQGVKLLEAKVLKDADELGNFGYLQIWRTFTYAALAKLSLFENISYWEKEGRLSRVELINNLYFAISKKVARRGLDKIDRFFKEIKEEAEGNNI